MIEMYPCINGNARPNNDQLKTNYKRVIYLLRIHTIPCESYLQYVEVVLFVINTSQAKRN